MFDIISIMVKLLIKKEFIPFRYNNASWRSSTSLCVRASAIATAFPSYFIKSLIISFSVFLFYIFFS